MTAPICRPSAAKRWFNCPGEPMVREVARRTRRQIPEYTLQGQRAHALREHWLTGRPITECIEPEYLPQEGEEWLPEDQILVVAQSVERARQFAQWGDLQTAIEVTLPLPFEKETLEGTIDHLFWNDWEVWVLDYKHGAGEYVPVEYNLQVGLYVNAARRVFGADRRYLMAIDQPRTGDHPLRFWEPPVEWLDGILVNANAAINRAYADDPLFVPGPHCKMCDGLKGYCPAMLSALLRVENGRMAREMGDDLQPPFWAIELTGKITKFLAGLKDEAFNIINAGGTVPGYRIDRVPTNRSWDRPDEVAATLAAYANTTVDTFQNTKITPKGIHESIALLKRYGVGSDVVDQMVSNGVKRALVPDDGTTEDPFRFGPIE